MSEARQRLGRRSEELAARHLAGRGMRIVARNQRLPSGEVDLIVVDGRTLAFVEVKARRDGASRGPETAALAVDARKRRRLRLLAREWLWLNRGTLPRHHELRFDVVAVAWARSAGPPTIEHIPDAF